MPSTQNFEAGRELPQPGGHPHRPLDEEQGLDVVHGGKLVQRETGAVFTTLISGWVETLTYAWSQLATAVAIGNPFRH
jgi:hypothetical protein